MPNKIYTAISLNEMDEFLSPQGFRAVQVEGTTEIVYGKLVGKDLCLRVYSSVAHGISRECGKDAIRVALVFRLEDGKIKGVGRSKRVHRIGTWKKNLQQRLDLWQTELLGPSCPHCKVPTRLRDGKYGAFWGCINYPACKYIEKEKI
jgi:hypothetical protein